MQDQMYSKRVSEIIMMAQAQTTHKFALGNTWKRKMRQNSKNLEKGRKF